MASITNRPGGHKWIFFTPPGMKRRALRLGKVSRDDAVIVKRHVERLLSAHKLGDMPDLKTVQWLTEIGEHLHTAIANVGLTKPRSARTVKQLCDWFEENNRGSCAPSTLRNIKASTRVLKEHFGDDHPIRLITHDDVTEFRNWLGSGANLFGGGLESTTISYRVRRLRQMFRGATKRGWIVENPFDEQRHWTLTNPDRDLYVGVDEFEAVLAAEKRKPQRLVMMLARYACLRCPSELVALRWDWVDVEHSTLFVKSPKTKWHPGGESRTVPLEPPLMALISQMWGEAPDGATLIFAEKDVGRPIIADRLQRACRRARVAAWQKPYINLRASGENDWMMRFPIHQVTAWVGHSPQTMLKHYNRVAKQQSAQAAVKLASGMATDLAPSNEAPEKCQNPKRPYVSVGARGQSTSGA